MKVGEGVVLRASSEGMAAAATASAMRGNV
jgi:hypothetical protein